jgi:hypothetical protein
VIRALGITLLMLMVLDHVVYDVRYIEAARMMRAQSLLYSDDQGLPFDDQELPSDDQELVQTHLALTRGSVSSH